MEKYLLRLSTHNYQGNCTTATIVPVTYNDVAVTQWRLPSTYSKSSPDNAAITTVAPNQLQTTICNYISQLQQDLL